MPASAKRRNHDSSFSLPSISPAQELSPGNLNLTSSASIFSVGPMSPALAFAMLRAIILFAIHDSIAPPPSVVGGERLIPSPSGSPQAWPAAPTHPSGGLVQSPGDQGL